MLLPAHGSSCGHSSRSDTLAGSRLPGRVSALGAPRPRQVRVAVQQRCFDEGSVPSAGSAAPVSDISCSSCTGLGLGGRTGALLISPRLPQGATVSTAFDHYSLLRTVEDSFGI